MARISLSQLRHSYHPQPGGEEDYALKRIDMDWEDGGAYALLGPSGCGKTTLLNIVSGLLAPSGGRVLFDGEDVTGLPTARRNIAQVFQFPVIYDTMSVRGNLAFPLRNRGVPATRIEERVREVAAMLELDGLLERRAAGLPPDVKQKISMGRGLVRDDVSAVLFDEPLTVIDPAMKWRLRSKLKELHQEIAVTMVYVTHDQTEALTFADRVVVMQEGEVVQAGTPEELFRRPAHTFVGHFIGSPGMNVLPCELREGAAFFNGARVETAGRVEAAASGRFEIGVRPEFVSLAGEGVEAVVSAVADLGRRAVVEARCGGSTVRAVVDGPLPERGAAVRLAFEPRQTRVYADGWLATVEPDGGPAGSAAAGAAAADGAAGADRGRP